MKPITLAAAITAIGLATLPASQALAFPDGPVEVVIPSGPGSGMDNLARTIARHLEEEMGVPFPAVNKPGAGHSVAARYLADAKPDGHTIMISHPQLLVSTATGILPFDPLEALVPLAQTGAMENFLVAPASAPFDDLEGLRAYAAENPLQVNGAIDGIVGLDHIVMLQLAEEMDIELNFVNVPGGGPAKVTSLMGDFTQLGVLGPGPFGGVKRSGDLKGLASLKNSPEPSIAFPDIPTSKEQGYESEFVLSWWWFAPAGTPEEVVEQLEQAIANVMADPAVQEEIVSRGITEPTWADAETARTQIRTQLDAVTKTVTEVGAMQK